MTHRLETHYKFQLARFFSVFFCGHGPNRPFNWKSPSIKHEPIKHTKRVDGWKLLKNTIQSIERNKIGRKDQKIL